MPLHNGGGSGQALPANPSLPSLREHEVFSAPITGSFQQKQTFDPATQKWSEVTIREGVALPSAGSKAPGAGVIKLFIGGAVSDNAPRAGGAPPSSLLGVSGSGTNAIGRFNWLGSYRPATGEMIVYKSYAPRPLPRPPAPKTKTPTAQLAVAAPLIEARTTRLKTVELTSGGGAGTPALPLKQSADEKAVIVFKVPVSREIELLKDVYLTIRNDKYRPIHFLDPVDTSVEPTYYTVVKKPIWLRQIETKLVEVRSEVGPFNLALIFPLVLSRTHPPPRALPPIHRGSTRRPRNSTRTCCWSGRMQSSITRTRITACTRTPCITKKSGGISRALRAEVYDSSALTPRPPLCVHPSGTRRR